MYSKDGENYFIVDAHIALWDARPENQRNIHGKQFIDCFYDYHRNLSPESEVWSYEDYLYQGGERLKKDLFDDGYVDHAIFQPAHLGEFYVNGFGQTEEASQLAKADPARLTYNHHFDPATGAGPRRAARRRRAARLGKGVKLYTAEWHGEPRLEARRPVGLPLLRGVPRARRDEHPRPQGPDDPPARRDAFDVADIDHVASDFTDLTFIVEHVGLPRLEDFCWIATQEPNVHGGLAVAMPFIHTRPRYFAQIIGEPSTGSARTASSSRATTRSGRPSGSSRSSSTSRSRRT